MTTPQDLDFNQTEETTVPSTFFPLHETFTSYPSSDRPLKGVEKVPQGQLSGSTQAKSTDVSSSQSTFNKKDDIMPIMENQQHYDIQAPGPIDSELSTSISKQLASQKEASISPKKGLKTGKKKEAKAQKNAPQKKKNPSFIKSKGQNSSSGKKKTPQSPYKNIYKAIFCEILSYIQIFWSLQPRGQQKIYEESRKSQEEWTEDTQEEPLLIAALNYDPAASQNGFIEFLENNKVKLMNALEDKRFVKFMPLYDMIRESHGLINEQNCRKYYEELKGRSLKNLQGEGKILTWLLIAGFSLVLFPAEASVHILPVQKDTVALLHWIISSRTQAKSKCMLLDAEHRGHIREFLETTFNDLLKSAMSQFPARHGWLTKVHDLVNERELPATTNAVEDDQNALKKAQYVLSDAQGAGGSTAVDSGSYSPSEDSGHETVDLEELSRNETAFLGRIKEITYDKNFLDYELIQDPKLEFSYNDEVVTNQKTLESLEEPFYATMHAFEKEIDRAWSKSGNKSLEIGDIDEKELRSAWKLQRDLNGKRVNFLCGGYDIESRKKVKKM